MLCFSYFHIGKSLRKVHIKTSFLSVVLSRQFGVLYFSDIWPSFSTFSNSGSYGRNFYSIHRRIGQIHISQHRASDFGILCLAGRMFNNPILYFPAREGRHIRQNVLHKISLSSSSRDTRGGISSYVSAVQFSLHNTYSPFVDSQPRLILHPQKIRAD